MRLPSAPDSPNFEETGPIRLATGARDPSYPDRARIDSDVRYLLRPPSTPWITFDKEEQQTILTSSRSSVIDAPGLFPDAPVETATAPAAAPIPPVEPSSMVVAADIQPPAEEHPDDVTHDEPLVPVSTPKRIIAAVGATIALAAMILIAVFAFGGKSETAQKAAASSVAPPGATAAAPVAPKQADLAPAPPPPPTAEAKSAKTGWAKLTIRGPAKGHRVYLDGKMLLGKGQRSFMIRCGDHTIAVGNKTDAKDVDVPCNGEYVVSK